MTFTATVAAVAPGAGTPTGTVQFNDNGTPLGSPAAVSANSASISIASLSTGLHIVTAVYSGDTSFSGSTSTELSQDVGVAAATVVLDISVRPPDHAIFREPVTYTATVHGPAGVAQVPTGTVTFTDGSTEVATVALDSSGQAAFVAKHLTIGLHVITAVYNGDADFTGSTSASSSFQQSPSPRRRPH